MWTMRSNYFGPFSPGITSNVSHCRTVRYDSESPGISSCHSDPMKSDYPRSGSWPARIRFAGMPQGLCRAGSVEGTIHRGMGSGIQRLSQGHPSAPMIPHAAGMDGIQRTPPFCGSWLPWLACTEGERRRSGFPFRSPDIGGLSGGWHAGRRDRRPWNRMCSCGPSLSPGRGCRRLVR